MQRWVGKHRKKFPDKGIAGRVQLRKQEERE
jgi:hypothetical protein